MTRAEFGELNPRVAIQEDTRACLSAAILSQLPEDSGISEKDVSEVLIEDGLYIEGVGTGLFSAHTLDNSLNKLGLAVDQVYPARVIGENEEQSVEERLAAIERAIRDGKQAILAFPKRREGEAPFMHYCVVSGFKETDEGAKITVMDPSDVDGGVRSLTRDEFTEYVKPDGFIAVMAWGIKKASETTADIANKIEEGGLPGFDLLTNPMANDEQSGDYIPTNTEHPSSVCMPNSYISRQFNVLGGIALSTDGKDPVGYPRFVVPPVIRQLSKQWSGALGNLPFPSRQSAEAATHMEKTYINGEEADTEVVEAEGLYWISDTKFNLDCWQRTGLGISSRQAQAVLEGRPNNDIARCEVAEQKIKTVIEAHTGAKPEDIYLFPTGMAAIYWLNQALIKVSGDAPAVQFGFPYTDTYDQRFFGPQRSVNKNMLDFRNPDYKGLQNLADSGQRLRSVMTEYPSNPLLWTPNFERLDYSLDGGTPIIIDDTIGTMFNLDDDKLPDSVAARATSLTKFFSSVGDVMGGSIVLRPSSPHYEQLKVALDELYEDTLWYEDAEALAANSELFPSVMPTINENGSEIAQWLNEEFMGPSKPLQTVYHPSLGSRQEYAAVKKDEAGYGGLLSLRFNDKKQAYDFFDAVRVTKGPSLGTYYTLGCLYTLLAHKNTDAVEKFGVPADLVRFSIGIEAAEDLKDRITEAMEASSRD